MGTRKAAVLPEPTPQKQPFHQLHVKTLLLPPTPLPLLLMSVFMDCKKGILTDWVSVPIIINSVKALTDKSMYETTSTL